MKKTEYKVVNAFNCFVLYVAMGNCTVTVTELADILQEKGNKFLEVLELRYSKETGCATYILKEKGFAPYFDQKGFEDKIDPIMENL